MTAARGEKKKEKSGELQKDSGKPAQRQRGKGSHGGSLTTPAVVGVVVLVVVVALKEEVVVIERREFWVP